MIPFGLLVQEIAVCSMEMKSFPQEDDIIERVLKCGECGAFARVEGTLMESYKDNKD